MHAVTADVVADPHLARPRFCELLIKYHITPLPSVMDTIERLYTLRMAVCSSSELAVELYEMVRSMVGTTTRRRLKKQHGLGVNGPLDPHKAPNVLAAYTRAGRPSTLKFLGAAAGGNVADGEAAAFAVWMRLVLVVNPASTARSCRVMTRGERKLLTRGSWGVGMDGSWMLQVMLCNAQRDAGSMLAASKPRHAID
jgi:hypothetical protein